MCYRLFVGEDHGDIDRRQQRKHQGLDRPQQERQEHEGKVKRNPDGEAEEPSEQDPEEQEDRDHRILPEDVAPKP